jgi:hypothetical protein
MLKIVYLFKNYFSDYNNNFIEETDQRLSKHFRPNKVETNSHKRYDDHYKSVKNYNHKKYM